MWITRDRMERDGRRCDGTGIRVYHNRGLDAARACPGSAGLRSLERELAPRKHGPFGVRSWIVN